MPLALLLVLVGLAGLLVLGASLVTLRASGASLDIGRRLAGPREMKVGSLLDSGELPDRPVRVVGRIRCADPLHAPGGERLVAFHRDVEVREQRGWRSIERLRETRSFELWDHDGSLTIDPGLAAEPLIAIPEVWRGRVDKLGEPQASAAARLSERHGRLLEARSVTRSLNVTDRLLVLARARRDDDGRVRLEPPPGGFLITNLALPDAMRLLGGRHRRAAVIGVVGLAVGTALLSVGAVGALVALALGA
ncbi:MAG: hypothetical protein ACRDGV_02470 [Candidatus Limnocylindria bacterium]